MTNTDTIASRYASVRELSGLSKKAFAESLGIHPVVSGDIELGKREPSRDVLVRLARVWGTDINWLL
ncbi:MAG TPA: helix-turn-helix transcriptional regulator, partial [Treponemataceae bacterium]|nr:helix-turn-helix transcriptional regulator [Treponemataceae bacterium]